MDKCPYCGADTRQGDNFCLNCGNRLLSTTPSSQQQAQPSLGEPTFAASENWGSQAPTVAASSSGANWEANNQTVASTANEPTIQEPAASTAQATMDRLAEPGRLILRSDSGEVLQEYPLDKTEIVIGRAPNSDILLSKDKLTSRRHATVLYENGKYVLRDERSANGTFVNGQQLEEVVPYELKENDHIGIGEHELIYRAFGSQGSEDVEDLPTVAVSYSDEGQAEMTYRTRDDAMATMPSSDEYGTYAMDHAQEAPKDEEAPVMVEQQQPEQEEVSSTPMENYAAVPAPVQPEPVATPEVISEPDVKATPVMASSFDKTERPAYAPSTPSSYAKSETPAAQDEQSDAGITFNRFSNLTNPALPDMSALLAALSTLDGQVMALQEQFNATQEAMQAHNSEVSQTANNLRSGIRRVSERMDGTIAEVARSREALAWAELLQLMEDVMNNPRDIEYVTKLARKARELNKVFLIHQNVLNTMAECNSLLRSMIGEDKK